MAKSGLSNQDFSRHVFRYRELHHGEYGGCYVPQFARPEACYANGGGIPVNDEQRYQVEGMRGVGGSIRIDHVV